MKTLVILLVDSSSRHLFDKCFGGKSSYELCLEWANRVSENVVVIKDEKMLMSGGQNECVSLKNWTVASLFCEMSRIATEKACDTIIYSYADVPFINDGLTKEMLETHEKYEAEYTFADGYPSGLSPEIINAGTMAILKNLAEGKQKVQGDERISRESIFNFLETDINAYEIETVISDEDFRLSRLHLDTSTLLTTKSCVALWEKVCYQNDTTSSTYGISALELSKIAVNEKTVCRTVPAYYQIEICSKHDAGFVVSTGSTTTAMKISDFSELVKKISKFSETATLSLSVFGEPLENPDFLEFVKVVKETELSLLIETNGQKATQELCEKIKEIAGNDITWIVSLDAVTKETYEKVKMVKNEAVCDFDKAVRAVKMLASYFPCKVYSQMTRMQQNENELEAFYRYWSNKENETGGNVIIQKYSSLSGTLPDYKPCDLSPLEKCECWHKKRDMVIYENGDVAFCRETVKSEIVGNAFRENLSDIWAKIGEKNCEKCEKCDEYYTFNF